MIRELRREVEKHKNDKLFTGETDIALMCTQVANRLEELMKFKQYFRELYGEGLEVVNWHLNGDTEPFDNFYDSAERAETE